MSLTQSDFLRTIACAGFVPIGGGSVLYRQVNSASAPTAMVSTAEKYALQIEIFTLSRGFRAQISRSCAQKRRFQQSVREQSGRTDFFNTIGRFPPVVTDRKLPSPGKQGRYCTMVEVKFSVDDSLYLIVAVGEERRFSR